jgi:hypothetical protein
MVEDDETKTAKMAQPRKFAAVIVDLLILSLVVYAGRVIALGSVVYLEGVIRHELFGYPPLAEITEQRQQIQLMPLISGRPMLLNILANDVAAAIMVLLYLGFLTLAFNGATPGMILARTFFTSRRGKSGLRGSAIIPELATLTWSQTPSWILARLGLKNLWDSVESLGKIAGSVRELFAPVRALPGAARPLGWVAIASVLILSAVLPLLSAYHVGLGTITFEDINSRPASIPAVAVYLSLLGLVIGWAVALVGASLMNPVLVLVAGLVYVFSFVSIGLSGGRSWWLVLPQWVLPLLVATSPTPPYRRWLRFAVLWTLSALAAFHTLRMTPLQSVGLTRSWMIAPLAGLAISACLARVQRRVAPAILFITAALVNCVFVVVAFRAGSIAVAGGLYLSLYQLMGILTLFWFLLGSNYIDACIGLAAATITKASHFFGDRLQRGLLVGVCLTELFIVTELWIWNPQIMQRPAMNKQSMEVFSTPGHEWVVFTILLIVAILAGSGKYTARAARVLGAVWAFSLFLTWAFFVQAIPFQGSESSTALQTVRESVEHGSQILAVALVSIGLVWAGLRNVARLHHRGNRRSTSTGSILFLLGLLALFASVSAFVFESRTVDALVADAYMYAGLAALWIPMAGWAAVTATHRIGARASGGIFASFALGALLSGLVHLERIALGDPGSTSWYWNMANAGAGVFLIAVSAVIIVNRSRPEHAVEASVMGVACALGFAVFYTQRIVLPIAVQCIVIVATLLGFSPDFTEPWSSLLKRAIPFADGIFFYLLAPVAGGMIGAFAFRTRKGRAKVAATLLSLGIAVLAMCYALPLYQSELASIKWDTSFSDPKLLAYVLMPAVAAALYAFAQQSRPGSRKHLAATLDF